MSWSWQMLLLSPSCACFLSFCLCLFHFLSFFQLAFGRGSGSGFGLQWVRLLLPHGSSGYTCSSLLITSLDLRTGWNLHSPPDCWRLCGSNQAQLLWSHHSFAVPWLFSQPWFLVGPCKQRNLLLTCLSTLHQSHPLEILACLPHQQLHEEIQVRTQICSQIV